MIAADARLEPVMSAEGVIRCCPVCGDPWESERFCIHADMTYGEALALRPDLSACVEAAGKAAYNRALDKHNTAGGTALTWEEAEPMTKHTIREYFLPVVAAVLAVAEAGE